MALASFFWPKVNIYATLECSFVTLRTLDLQRPLVLLLKVLLLAPPTTNSTFRAICSNPVCGGLLVWPSHGFLGIWRPPLSSSSSAQRRSTHPAHQRDCPAAAPALSDPRPETLFYWETTSATTLGFIVGHSSGEFKYVLCEMLFLTMTR